MPGGATEDELVEQLVERGVTGIIFLSGLHADPPPTRTRYAQLTARGVPFVLINGYNERIAAPVRLARRPARRPGWPCGICAELGHERIGLAVGPDRFVPARRKVEGFVAARWACGATAG